MMIRTNKTSRITERVRMTNVVRGDNPICMKNSSDGLINLKKVSKKTHWNEKANRPKPI